MTSVFKLAVKFLAVVLRAEHIKQVFLIILVASHYQFDFFPSALTLFVLIVEDDVIGADFLFCPFGSQLRHYLIKSHTLYSGWHTQREPFPQQSPLHGHGFHSD